MKTLYALFVLFLHSVLTVSAYSFKVEGIYYNITSSADKTVEVQYENYYAATAAYTGDITIPSTVVNNDITYSVTGISNYAFYKCTLTSITIPQTVTSIGTDAFEECTSLAELSLSSGVTSIGDYAFKGCTALPAVILPGSVTTCGRMAFSGCTALTSVVISEGVKMLGQQMFSSCSNLASVIIPKSVTSFSDNVFSNCNKLTDIYYAGSQSDWNSITKLSNAAIPAATTIHYDSAGSGSNTDNTPDNPGGGSSTDEGTTVQPTDISGLDNVIFFNETRQWEGRSITMPMLMNNSADITAMQFDLVMPDGILLQKDDNGNHTFAFSTSTNRITATSHTVTSHEQTDGSLRILCYSLSNAAIEGSQGAVMDFPVTVAADAAPGEYAVVLKNILLTATDKTEYAIDEVVCRFIVPSYTMGDVNNDGKINITDIVYTTDNILGNTDELFVENAADMNGDEEVNVTDIVLIADKILNKDEDVSKAKDQNSTPKDSNTSLGIRPFSISPDERRTVSLELTNPDCGIVAVQCNVILPDGLSIADDERISINESAGRTDRLTHTLASAVQTDGSHKVVCFSLQNDAFRGSEGAIIDIPVVADADMPAGVYDLRLSDIVVTDTHRCQQKLTASTTVTVGSTTTLSSPVPVSSEDWYDLSGRKVGAGHRGVKVAKGGKTIVRQ